MSGIASTMEKAAESAHGHKMGLKTLPDLEVERNIKTIDNFMTAILSGNFPGQATPHIAALLGFLQSERTANISEFESRHPKSSEKKNEPA
ncbi:MAG: hypothetical protein KGJ13_08470 [Patescibacteria group bacterium]|nr:hypothetical protein [Patescibacteria group bacterium]